MNFLKSIWRKLFGVKTGVYTCEAFEPQENSWAGSAIVAGSSYGARKAYDPSQDENKLMNGESESYFE